MKFNKELIGQIVICSWLDASQTETTKKQLEKKDLFDFILETKTYGKVLKISRQGIMIAYSITLYDFDVITIPAKMINKIRILKHGK